MLKKKFNNPTLIYPCEKGVYSILEFHVTIVLLKEGKIKEKMRCYISYI